MDMRVESYHSLSDGIFLKLSQGQIKINICAGNIFRIVYTLSEEFSEKESLMIVQQVPESVDWSVEEKENDIIVSTGQLGLIIHKRTARFTYVDRDGGVLVKEPCGGGKTLVPVDVEKYIFDEDAEITVEETADGVVSRATNLKTVIDRKAYHAKLEFDWDNEALYGLGSHEEGVMNLRGHHQYLYQHNMKAVVPVLVSTKGYGILFDTYSFMTFHDDMHGSYLWTDVVDELDYYFIYGPEFDAIVSGYRKLTGRVPMLPKWAFGYVQSKERYKTQEELVSVVKEYRKRRIPLDLIVQDWMTWPEGLWGEKSFDPERFPDPEGMVEEIHRLNARVMISVWPTMNKGGANYIEMQEHGCMLADQRTYSAFSEKARSLYWKQANEGLFSKGIDAWWCDCTEPFEADWKGSVKPEPEQRIVINVSEFKKYIDPAYINAYSLVHSKGMYEGQRWVTSEKRVVNLTRSSYAGQQRYATITWSGDVTSTWRTLKNQIPAGLNFCVTGCPYWTLDIGGFFVRKGDLWFISGDFDQGCEDLGYRELYVRWFQYGTFLPMFRSHGTDTPREVWRFGEPGSLTYDTLIEFIDLRYRLLPYIYSLAGAVTHDDYTMLRALPFDFREDTNTYNISDQFLFGPAFLVNPVTEPMYYGPGSRELKGTKKTRKVYLPRGCDWYDFWTGERLAGGQTIEARAELDIMPLYVRVGAIVPFGPKVQYSSEKPDAPIELRIYPGADGEFVLYEDEGDNYNYEYGQYATTVISWDDEKRVLTFSNRSGSFQGMVEKREYSLVLVSASHGCGVEEVSQPDKVVVYDGTAMSVSL